MNVINQLTAQDANASFYEAFQRLSISDMDRIWSHGDDSICVHPGWELVIGWLAIKESWVQIFDNTEEIEIIANTLRVRKYANLAIVICLEHIKTMVNDRLHKFGVLATNVFEDSDGIWLLSHHHGSAISNYFFPNADSI